MFAKTHIQLLSIHLSSDPITGDHIVLNSKICGWNIALLSSFSPTSGIEISQLDSRDTILFIQKLKNLKFALKVWNKAIFGCTKVKNKNRTYKWT